MATLKEGVKTEKRATSLAYFQEKSKELVAMGAKLLIEGRDTS